MNDNVIYHHTTQGAQRKEILVHFPAFQTRTGVFENMIDFFRRPA
jgi:hypothetical protein